MDRIKTVQLKENDLYVTYESGSSTTRGLRFLTGFTKNISILNYSEYVIVLMTDEVDQLNRRHYVIFDTNLYVKYDGYFDTDRLMSFITSAVNEQKQEIMPKQKPVQIDSDNSDTYASVSGGIGSLIGLLCLGLFIFGVAGSLNESDSMEATQENDAVEIVEPTKSERNYTEALGGYIMLNYVDADENNAKIPLGAAMDYGEDFTIAAENNNLCKIKDPEKKYNCMTQNLDKIIVLYNKQNSDLPRNLIRK